MEIHSSDIDIWNKCRLAAFWSMRPPLGLGLTRTLPPTALSIGVAVHTALQEFYDNGLPPAAVFSHLIDQKIDSVKENLFEEEVQEMLRTRNILVGVLRMYPTWSRNVDEGVRFLALESPWKTTINGVPCGGRFDGVVLRGNDLWILEFKTTSATTTDWILDAVQPLLYTAAAVHLFKGFNVRGVLYRFIVKKNPMVEELVLKSGKLTTRQDLPSLTTRDIYINAIKAIVVRDYLNVQQEEAFAMVHAGEFPLELMPKFLEALKEYQDTVERLPVDENPFLFERPRPVYPRELEVFVKYFLPNVFRDITSKDRWIAPTGISLGWAVCGSCIFKNPCRSLRLGKDFRMLLYDKDVYTERVDDYETGEA